MGRRFAVGLVFALAALPLIGAGSAEAATEFGNSCAANTGVTGVDTLTTLASPAGSLPITAPSGGIITKLQMTLGASVPFKIPEQVKLLRSAGGNKFTTTNQVTMEIGTGANTASVRMPVEAGERLGVHGLPFSYEGSSSEGIALYCAAVTGGALGVALADVPLGATAEFNESSGATAAVAATIEPDADHDGYGDETQDKCPQSAATQAACPTITLDSLSITGRTKATVYVTASTETPVKVTGAVKLGGGLTANLGGGTQTVAPGKLVRFTLKFSKPLVKQLKALPKSKKLTLSVTASATNVAGQVSTDTTTAKLKGQE